MWLVNVLFEIFKILTSFLIMINQANAGIGLSIVIILISMLMCLISVLAGIGIYERCSHISGGGGNIHFLISHVLGSKFGGSISIIYCFGQVIQFFWS